MNGNPDWMVISLQTDGRIKFCGGRCITRAVPQTTKWEVGDDSVFGVVTISSTIPARSG